MYWLIASSLWFCVKVLSFSMKTTCLNSTFKRKYHAKLVMRNEHFKRHEPKQKCRLQILQFLRYESYTKTSLFPPQPIKQRQLVRISVFVNLLKNANTAYSVMANAASQDGTLFVLSADYFGMFDPTVLIVH